MPFKVIKEEKTKTEKVKVSGRNSNVSFRTQELERDVGPDLFKFWNDLWLRGGGTTRRNRK